MGNDNKDYKIQWGRVFNKLSPSNIKKGMKYISHYGIKGFYTKLTERFTPEEIPYETWYPYHFINEEGIKKQKNHRFSINPCISIVVPTYETPESFLIKMVDSVLNQTYSNLELCIVDGSATDKVKETLENYSDDRIKYIKLNENLGIAENTNAGIMAATGEYIGFLDHDDYLEPDALFMVVEAINNNRNVDMLYTDEDKVNEDGTEFFAPALKPDFNIDLLRSNNYICHFVVIKTKIVKTLGGLRKEFDGAQDYDMVFRASEKAEMIVHIPKILYHWRVHEKSTSENPQSKMYAFEAGNRAIKAHLERLGLAGEVYNASNLGFYRVKYKCMENPMVSIIIPNKDNREVLDKCIKSILKTSYTNYEVLVIENNSSCEETFKYYDEIKSDKVKILYWKDKFNYSAINNFGVENAKGDYLLFLNNDVEFISDDWMEELLSHCEREDVGAVGAKLYYNDNTIQHAGTIIGIGGIAGHAFVGMPREQSGYFHKASIQLDLSAVTAACMMVKRKVFEEVGRFEERLEVAFNDVDLCLKINKAGYLVVYNPYVEAYHYESKTRGHEDTKEKVERFQQEIEFMRTKWIEILKSGDPYYNKNLTLDKWNYSLRKNH